MTNLIKSKKLYDLVGQGQLLEAFDANYAENIVMEEPSGKRINMEQVAVQQWEQGQIVHERFYYNA